MRNAILLLKNFSRGCFHLILLLVLARNVTGWVCYHHAFAKEVGRIANGSHRHKGIGRLMLGSTANAVLHGTPCDMLVIRVK